MNWINHTKNVKACDGTTKLKGDNFCLSTPFFYLLHEFYIDNNFDAFTSFSFYLCAEIMGKDQSKLDGEYNAT